MDHHCSWINNCVGLENYRYFLLFVLYSWVGLGYNLITILAIWNHHVYRQNQSMMNFITLLDFVLLCVMCGVVAWNWFLAMSGWSSVEIWSNKMKSGIQRYDYYFRSISDNLYKVFGTYNPFAILSPSLRNVPFSGIEWSY